MKKIALFPKTASPYRVKSASSMFSSAFRLNALSKVSFRRNLQRPSFRGEGSTRWGSSFAFPATLRLTSDEEAYLERLFHSLSNRNENIHHNLDNPDHDPPHSNNDDKTEVTSASPAGLWAACVADGPACPLAVLHAAYQLRREFQTNPPPPNPPRGQTEKTEETEEPFEKNEQNETIKSEATSRKEEISYEQAYELLLRSREGPLAAEFFFRALLIDSDNPAGVRHARLLLVGLREWGELLAHDPNVKEGENEQKEPVKTKKPPATAWGKPNGEEFPILAWLRSKGVGHTRDSGGKAGENQTTKSTKITNPTPSNGRLLAQSCAVELLSMPGAAEGLVLFWRALLPSSRGVAFACAASKLLRRLARDRHRREWKREREVFRIDQTPLVPLAEEIARDEKARFHAQIRELLAEDEEEEAEWKGNLWGWNHQGRNTLREVATTYAVCVWLREADGDFRLRNPRENLDALAEVIALLDKLPPSKKKKRNQPQTPLLLTPCAIRLYTGANLHRLWYRHEIPFAVWMAFDLTRSLRELRRTGKENRLAPSEWWLHSLDVIEGLQKILLVVDRTPSVDTPPALQALWYVILKEACEGSFASDNRSDRFSATPAPNDLVEMKETTSFARVESDRRNRENSETSPVQNGLGRGGCAVLLRLVLPQYRPSLWRRPTVNLFIRLLHQWGESDELRRVFTKISQCESKYMNEAWDCIHGEREGGGESNGEGMESIQTKEKPSKVFPSSSPAKSGPRYVPALTLRSCEIILAHCVDNREGNSPTIAQTAHEVIQYMLLSLRLMKFHQETSKKEGKTKTIGQGPHEDEEEEEGEGNLEAFVEEWVERIQREYIPKLPNPI
ncbi:unnamed protein product [Phytomonas sp. EM1]|nr:unnamed protein product [Phytomonas sp. EM1]|eukprot:CCW65134.1 unnamed protein product [Phytomonas sp. isolate EM1]